MLQERVEPCSNHACSNHECLRFDFKFSKMDEICGECASTVSNGTHVCIDCGRGANGGRVYAYFDHVPQTINLVCSDCYNSINFCSYDRCATKYNRVIVLPLDGANYDEEVQELLDAYLDLTDDDGNVLPQWRGVCLDCAEKCMKGEDIDDCYNYPYPRGPF